MLAGTDSWDLDVFKLAKLTNGCPIATLALKIFHDRGLVQSLKLDVVCRDCFCALTVD